MKYLSICSGIEAASVAWEPLGWTPVGFSEIEKFPSAVLAHHWPDVPNLGDMTKFDDWNIATIDILAGGTPCQAFSVAGLRQGLADERGNLSLVFCDLANHFDPEWIVWENVPGVLSSKDNAFGCFLAGLVGADAPLESGGKWANAGVVSGPKRTAAWRILDAQFFGVAQRRRRVFVLACRGSGNFACARALFPIGESVFGDSPPRRETRESIARGFECGPQGGGYCNVAPTLDTRCKDGPIRNQLGAGVITPSVTSKWAKGSRGPAGDECQNLVAHSIQAGALRENPNSGPDGIGVQADVAYTLEARSEVQAVAFAENSRSEVRLEGGDGQQVGTLSTGGGKPGQGTPCVAFNLRGREGGAMPEFDPDGLASQRAASGGSSRSYIATSAVRRLTPRECERLQGFPDDHTLIPAKVAKKITADMYAYLRATYPEMTAEEAMRLAKDGPRYKAIGNSMAVPVMRWIGLRIAAIKSSDSIQ